MLYTFTATDLDAGENGRVTLSLISGEREFSLNAISGELNRLRAPLDREQNDHYTIEVLATDNGSHQGGDGDGRRSCTTLLKIRVLDRDDNSPSFPPGVEVAGYRFAVAGDGVGLAQGDSVGVVHASDPDTPPYATFTYAITASRHSAGQASRHTGVTVTSPSGRGEDAGISGSEGTSTAVAKDASSFFSVHPLSGVITCKQSISLPFHFRFWIVAADPAGEGQRVSVVVTSQARSLVTWISPYDSVKGIAKQTDIQSKTGY